MLQDQIKKNLVEATARDQVSSIGEKTDISIPLFVQSAKHLARYCRENSCNEDCLFYFKTNVLGKTINSCHLSRRFPFEWEYLPTPTGDIDTKNQILALREHVLNVTGYCKQGTCKGCIAVNTLWKGSKALTNHNHCAYASGNASIATGEIVGIIKEEERKLYERKGSPCNRPPGLRLDTRKEKS